MGIKELLPFLKSKSPKSFTQSILFHGIRIAIDTPIFMYKFAYSVGTGKNLCNRMLKFSNDLIKLGIVPVFVFDGASLHNKENEKIKRFNALCKETEKRLKNEWTTFQCGELDFEVERSPCPSFRPVSEDFMAFKLALKVLGVQTEDAQYEAEALCSYMNRKGKVDAILTEDSDTLAYLAPNVILKWDGEKGETVNISMILEDLALTSSQFQDLCVLLGNDFNERIKGIGPVKALELIKKFGNLQEIISKRGLEENLGIQMKASRAIFENICYECVEIKNDSEQKIDDSGGNIIITDIDTFVVGNIESQ